MKKEIKRKLNLKSRIRRVFWKDEALRPVWRVIFACLIYLGAFNGVLYGLAAIFGHLFDLWGLTNDNLTRAPIWAQTVVYLHSDFCYGMAYLISAVLGRIASRRGIQTLPRSKSVFPTAVLLGFLLSAGLTGLALLTDSVRLEKPLSEPQFYLQTLIAFFLIFAGKWSQEVLCRRLIYAQLRKKRLLAITVSALVTMILTGEWTVCGAFSGLLLGVVACSLYERGGLLACTAFQTVWTAWSTLLFAFPGMTANATPVYTLYHVSDAWLTGGNRSILSGLWCTLALFVFALFLYRKDLENIYQKMQAFRQAVKKSKAKKKKH